MSRFPDSKTWQLWYFRCVNFRARLARNLMFSPLLPKILTTPLEIVESVQWVECILSGREFLLAWWLFVSSILVMPLIIVPGLCNGAIEGRAYSHCCPMPPEYPWILLQSCVKKSTTGILWCRPYFEYECVVVWTHTKLIQCLNKK